PCPGSSDGCAKRHGSDSSGPSFPRPHGEAEPLRSVACVSWRSDRSAERLKPRSTSVSEHVASPLPRCSADDPAGSAAHQRPGCRLEPDDPSSASQTVIRPIRVLGAALGGIIGLALATPSPGLFSTEPYGGAYLAAWVIAWVVVGFGIFPYLTVVPAIRLIRWVQELS